MTEGRIDRWKANVRFSRRSDIEIVGETAEPEKSRTSSLRTFAPLVDSATADSAAFSMAPASLAIAAQIWGDQAAANTEGS